ncbi:MAG: hypothetical protein LC808_43925 [Actinobacteria bacterium]|nr:hypothetical protein [Actinomycetota bacterium]
MAGPADHQGFPALAAHEVHPCGSVGLPVPVEVGKFSNLMDLNVIGLLADLAHVPEESLDDLAVAVWGGIRDTVREHRSCSV